MKYYFCLLCTLYVLVAACPALSAQILIEGQVVDQERQPISYVTVQSNDLAQTVQTDEEGRFRASAEKMPIRLTFSHAGFIPRTVRIDSSEQTFTVVMTRQVYPMEGITVTAGRAIRGRNAVSFQDIDHQIIERDYDIGEVPEFLEITPNLYSYSDAGGGLGYSYLKIRGFDARRAPVYINGVPLNDPEDHALYFVDLPDFTANADNIQIQRGVGNSLYGDAAFGGSINILTSVFSDGRQFVSETGYGGFLQDGKTVGLMRKSSVSYSTGLIDGIWSLSGRWVKQYTGGYRKNAWTDATAYYLSIGRIDPGMITTLDIYGGPMKTHAAWWGITRATMHLDRRYNPYTYADEADNFVQPHYELHNIYNLSENVSLNNTLYHIKGKGYYEEYQFAGWGGDSLYHYNLTDDTTLTGELVRRKWVDKGQWGFNSRVEIQGSRHRTAVGGSYYFFESEHWGEVLWAQPLGSSLLTFGDPPRYYENFGKIHNASAFASRHQEIGERLTLTGNVQVRYRHLNVHQTPFGIYEGHIYGINWLFMSPRAGLIYTFDENLSGYFGFSIASHDPHDNIIDDTDDPADVPNLEFEDRKGNIAYYGDPLVDPERVYDFEWGMTYQSSRLSFDANLFWMEYRNEVVPDGGLDDDGFPTVGNAERSVHRGLELAASFKPHSKVKVEGNYSFNDNWIKEYDQHIIDYGGDSTILLQRRDVPVPNFPTFIGNLAVEYSHRPLTVVYRLRAVGRQFPYFTGRFDVLNGRLTDVSIAPYAVSSIKAMINIGSVLGNSRLSLEGRVDNLFDQKYETFGAFYRDAWSADYYYWPAAERNWFVNLKLMI